MLEPPLHIQQQITFLYSLHTKKTGFFLPYEPPSKNNVHTFLYFTAVCFGQILYASSSYLNQNDMKKPRIFQTATVFLTSIHTAVKKKWEGFLRISNNLHNPQPAIHNIKKYDFRPSRCQSVLNPTIKRKFYCKLLRPKYN